MKFNINVKKEVEVAFVKVMAGCRYSDDFRINDEDQPEDDFSKLPLWDDQGETWTLVINAETGVIEGWPKGVTCYAHSKVCDNGTYQLLDSDRNILFEHSGYVPNEIIPGQYGDYIVMNIDAIGKVKEWAPDFQEFVDNYADEEE